MSILLQGEINNIGTVHTMPMASSPSTASPSHGQQLPKRQLSMELLPWACSIQGWHVFGNYPKALLLVTGGSVAHNPQGPLNALVKSSLKGHTHGWAATSYIRAEALKHNHFCSLELWGFPGALHTCRDGDPVLRRISDSNLIPFSWYFSLLCHPRDLKYQIMLQHTAT